MARCCACGAETGGETTMLARNRDQQWVVLCPDCHRKGVSPSRLVPLPLGPDPALAGSPLAPLADTFSVVLQALALARARRGQDAVRARTRGHDRRAVEIAVRFTLARDDVSYTGLVTDLSPGGLRLLSGHLLEKGQLLSFDGKMPLPAALLALFRNAAEVRHVDQLPDGRWMAGARFLQRQAARGANRRRHRRHPAEFDCLYQRTGSDVLSHAKVADMSQGGMMLYASEAVELQEAFRFRVRGESGSFAQGDLVGEASVLRAIPRAGFFEIGCRFSLTRVEPRRTARPLPEGTAAPPPAAGGPAPG